MKKFLSFLLCLLASTSVLAQSPVGLIVGATPVIGGSSGNCLTISSGSLSSATCGGAPSGSAGGVLAGTYPNPTLASITSQNVTVNNTPGSTAQLQVGDAAFPNKNPDNSAIATAGNIFPFMSVYTNNNPASGTNQGAINLGVFNATPNSPTINFFMSGGTATAPVSNPSGAMYLASYNFMSTTQKWCQTAAVEGGQNGDALTTVSTSRGKIQLAVADGANVSGCLDQSGPGLQVVYNFVGTTNDIPFWLYHTGVAHTNNGFPATAVLAALDWTTNSGKFTISTVNRGGGGTSDMVLTASSGNLSLSNSNNYAPAGTWNYLGTVTGTDTITVSPSPAYTAYTTGACYYWKAAANNATTTPTININALGAKTIVKRASTALAASDIVNGAIEMTCYDGTNMQLLNPVVN
jgi:hypothetical protein